LKETINETDITILEKISRNCFANLILFLKIWPFVNCERYDINTSFLFLAFLLISKFTILREILYFVDQINIIYSISIDCSTMAF